MFTCQNINKLFIIQHNKENIFWKQLTCFHYSTNTSSNNRQLRHTTTINNCHLPELSTDVKSSLGSPRPSAESHPRWSPVWQRLGKGTRTSSGAKAGGKTLGDDRSARKIEKISRDSKGTISKTDRVQVNEIDRVQPPLQFFQTRRKHFSREWGGAGICQMRDEGPHGVGACLQFGTECGEIGVRFEFDVFFRFPLIYVHSWNDTLSLACGEISWDEQAGVSKIEMNETLFFSKQVVLPIWWSTDYNDLGGQHVKRKANTHKILAKGKRNCNI